MDDILLTGNDIEKLKVLGEPDTFLGIQIIIDRESQVMKLSQKDYIEEMLIEFNMWESRPKDTPVVTRQVKSKNIKNGINMRKPTNAPYRAAWKFAISIRSHKA